MSCLRKVPLLSGQIKERHWDYKIAKPIHRLRGQKLGLLGFGRIPQALAAKALPFGFELLVYDPFVDEKLINHYGARQRSLDEILQEADIVSVHVPLLKTTEHLLSTKEFKKMKNSAIVINTSRGPLIDENALIEALQTGEIAGAGLDVLENEPAAKDNPLLDMENVILTPHIAWYSEESEIELKQKAARGVADVLRGKKPDYIVNKNVLDRIALS